jgi:hypothetical protein
MTSTSQSKKPNFRQNRSWCNCDLSTTATGNQFLAGINTVLHADTGFIRGNTPDLAVLDLMTTLNARHHGAGMLTDPMVSSLDELDAEASVLLVGVANPRHRWSIEVIERHEEPNRRAVVGDQVLQHEEIDVSPEVLEQ